MTSSQLVRLRIRGSPLFELRYWPTVFRSSLRLENLYRQGFEVENASFNQSNSSLAENTFPIDRWCRDIVLSIISQSVLFAAVTIAIGFHIAALSVFIACVVLSIVYLVLCKAKNLRPSIDLLMSWQYRHTLGALFLVFPCLPGSVFARRLKLTFFSYRCSFSRALLAISRLKPQQFSPSRPLPHRTLSSRRARIPDDHPGRLCTPLNQLFQSFFKPSHYYRLNHHYRRILPFLLVHGNSSVWLTRIQFTFTVLFIEYWLLPMDYGLIPALFIAFLWKPRLWSFPSTQFQGTFYKFWIVLDSSNNLFRQILSRSLKDSE